MRKNNSRLMVEKDCKTTENALAKWVYASEQEKGKLARHQIGLIAQRANEKALPGYKQKCERNVKEGR